MKKILILTVALSLAVVAAASALQPARAATADGSHAAIDGNAGATGERMLLVESMPSIAVRVAVPEDVRIGSGLTEMHSAFVVIAAVDATDGRVPIALDAASADFAASDGIQVNARRAELPGNALAYQRAQARAASTS